MIQPLVISRRGQVDYLSTWQAMRAFTDQRTTETPDELWLLEHAPVYTLGQAADEAHINPSFPSDIPLVRTDRGGEVTYHGPGQLIAYFLLDLSRRAMGVRHLVSQLEAIVIATLADYAVVAVADANARGVYVEGKKIASIGLRVRRGCCYHGVALNLAMDLGPFAHINPCGYANLSITQLADETDSAFTLSSIQDKIAKHANHLIN